jgi:type II secretory pathway pseudopilin PulG
MKRKSTLYCALCNRNGLTLVEVVAGLLLLSTLLVGILKAYGNHVRQIKRAQQKLEAIALADRMLGEWFKNPGWNILNGNYNGNTNVNKKSNEPQLTWRTYTVENRDLQKTLGVKIVRLEILNTVPAKENDILTAIEVLVPETLSKSRDDKTHGMFQTANIPSEAANRHDAN